MTVIRTYSELVRLRTFEERFGYLRLGGKVGKDTFGFDRYLNQEFYRSARWKSIRDEVIIRDEGRDLGAEGYDIPGKIIIHHMNPLLPEDIERESPMLLDPEYLICVSLNTHNAIHYGDESLIIKGPVVRKRYDTCPWKC